MLVPFEYLCSVRGKEREVEGAKVEAKENNQYVKTVSNYLIITVIDTDKTCSHRIFYCNLYYIMYLVERFERRELCRLGYCRPPHEIYIPVILVYM